MARKKDRAFFVCPRWNEVVTAPQLVEMNRNGSKRGSDRIIATIKDGQPVARSTLRKALLAARCVSGLTFDVDDYMVDQRIKAR
jgi:hypothetical protein